MTEIETSASESDDADELEPYLAEKMKDPEFAAAFHEAEKRSADQRAGDSRD